MATNTGFGNHVTSGLFAGLKKPAGIKAYAKMRGVTDFSKAEQFDLYEGGYPFLVMLRWPKFFDNLTGDDKELVEAYRKVVEYEFKNLEGIEDITSEAGEISNGINMTKFITKVTRPSDGTFQMRFNEKAGSTITRTHELFLRNVKDPDTQVKMYPHRYTNGAWGYEYETFTYLYFTTDSALLNIEKAYLIANAQPTKAETSIYNGERGQIEFKEVSVEINGFLISNPIVTQKANTILQNLITTNNYTISDTYQAQSMTTGVDGSNDPGLNYTAATNMKEGAAATSWT